MGISVCQAEDGVRESTWSRGLGDVYKEQQSVLALNLRPSLGAHRCSGRVVGSDIMPCLLYTSDAADE